MENKNIVRKITKKDFLKEQEEMGMEIELQKEPVGNNFAEMISKLNTSSIQVHIFHWQVKGKSSYAAHQAFGGYYEEIADLIDGLVESYQGKYGIIENFTCDGVENFKDIQTCVDYLAGLMEMIDEKRKSVEDSYLQNQIDAVVELITSTMYKLRFLH